MRELFAAVGPELSCGLSWVQNWEKAPEFAHVLIEDNGDDICPVLKAIAAGEGPIPIVQLGGRGDGYMAAWMLEEVVVSIDTTAAGGNASLMALA
jgi:RHH-type transcriptional regulator, proline utilization regulon repressor / proline dehydrogenase / delta 1-pyrroline-5-carboxylate dehydrogenase